MNIFAQQKQNQLIGDAEDHQEFDEDMTGKEIKKIKELRNQAMKEKLKAEGKSPIEGEIESGIADLQNPFLLKHFNLLLVGKPGSGKSTLMKKMIEQPEYYKDKFDDILVISPSLSKLELDILEDNTSQAFDFDWIFEQVFKINRRQLRQLQHTYMEQDRDIENAKRQRFIKGNKTFTNSFNSSLHANTMVSQSHLQTGNNLLSLNDYVAMLNQVYKDRQPQNIANISTMIQLGAANNKTQASLYGMMRPREINKIVKRGEEFEGRKQRNSRQKKKIEMIQKYSDEVHKLYKLHVGTKEEMKKSHINVLLLLDDVVGELHQHQHSFQLSKLFLNRRHLIPNGTLSIMVTTQKYTMIPARIRSNSNWMVLFRLNPVDFEIARTDATSFQKKSWENVLKHVFGENIIQDQQKARSVSNETQLITDFNFLSIHVNGNRNQLFRNQDQFEMQ